MEGFSAHNRESKCFKLFPPVSYNESKEIMMHTLNETKETMSIRLISSAIAGIAVAIFSLPFDNVKTKILKMKPSN